MIRVPPAYLEHIPSGVVRLCDHYDAVKPGVWYIRLNGNSDIRIDVNKAKRRERLSQPSNNESYVLESGKIQIWVGELPLVLVGAECGWSHLDILGCKLDELRSMLDRVNRAIWKEISQI